MRCKDKYHWTVFTKFYNMSQKHNSVEKNLQGKEKCSPLKAHKMTYPETKQQLTICGCSGWPSGCVFDSVRYTLGQMTVSVYLVTPVTEEYLTGPPSPTGLSQSLSTSSKSWFKPRKHSGEVHCYSKYPLKIWLLTMGFTTRKSRDKLIKRNKTFLRDITVSGS